MFCYNIMDSDVTENGVNSNVVTDQPAVFIRRVNELSNVSNLNTGGIIP